MSTPFVDHGAGHHIAADCDLSLQVSRTVGRELTCSQQARLCRVDEMAATVNDMLAALAPR